MSCCLYLDILANGIRCAIRDLTQPHSEKEKNQLVDIWYGLIWPVTINSPVFINVRLFNNINNAVTWKVYTKLTKIQPGQMFSIMYIILFFKRRLVKPVSLEIQKTRSFGCLWYMYSLIRTASCLAVKKVHKTCKFVDRTFFSLQSF